MKFLKRALITVVVLFAGLYIWGKIYSIEPALVTRQIVADTGRIKDDLYFLTKECRFRNFMHPEQLNKSADYIKAQFDRVSFDVSFQHYQVKGEEFKNVICSLGPRDA